MTRQDIRTRGGKVAGGIPHRGAVVLVAVLAAVAMIASSVSVVLLRADAATTRTSTSLRHSQSRAAAWSGVRAAMSELAASRNLLLRGGVPEVTGAWLLARTAETPAMTVRLIDLGPTEGVLLQSEAAKLNLNRIEEWTASRSALLSEADESAILARVSAGPVGSVAELCGWMGITVDRVYGSVLGTHAASIGHEQAWRGAVSGDGPMSGGSGALPALSDSCTVYSADPNVQVGIGPDGAGYAGAERINLGLGWTEELAMPIARRFGADAVSVSRQVIQSGSSLKTMKDVVGLLRRMGVPVRQWASFLDAFTTTADPFVIGRVDILRADVATIASVPGITPEAAERMVGSRDRLDMSARCEITWPLIEGFLSVEEFEEAVDFIANCSLQWRVMVEAGRARRGPSGSAAGELSDRVVFEAVLDVAGPRARVAYLRDVTALQAIRMMNEEAWASDDAGSWEPAWSPSPSTAGAGSVTGEPVRASGGRVGESDDSGGSSSPGATPVDTPPPAVRAETGVDRRVGRWNAAGVGGGRR